MESFGLSLMSGSGRWTGGNGCQDHWHSATGFVVLHGKRTDEPSCVSVCLGTWRKCTDVGDPRRVSFVDRFLVSLFSNVICSISVITVAFSPGTSTTGWPRENNKQIDFLYRDDEKNNPNTLTSYVQYLEKNKKGFSIYIVTETVRKHRDSWSLRWNASLPSRVTSTSGYVGHIGQEATMVT